MTVVNDPGRKRVRPADGGSNAYLARRLVAQVRHEAELNALADSPPGRWSDRLRAEARFHLAAMVNALELAIASAVADPAIAALLGELGSGYCRSAIAREPGLLSPDFIDHLRRRAAVAMLLRQAGERRGAPSALAQQPSLEAPHGDALTAMASAEQAWRAPMLLDTQMTPDLPAEPFHELAWSVAALLVKGCERRMDGDDSRAAKSIGHATERILAGHDEAQGAIGLARRFARTLPPERRFALASAALADARLLLFSALTESEAGLPIEAVIDALIDHDEAPRHALFRLMRVDDATAFCAAERLAPLTGMAAGGDEALALFVENYRLVDQAEAVRWREGMMRPPALADKLALMEDPA